MQSAQDIEQCIQRNLPSDTMIQTLKVVTLDRVGAERTLETELWWQRDQAGLRVHLAVDNPRELRGTKVFMLARNGLNDMFIYRPELSRARRITSQMAQQGMLGTDYSYEDFGRLQGLLTNLEGGRTADAQIDGRATFVTESVPAIDAGSEYSRIRTWVDQETCVPLVIEYYTKEVPDPAKVMSANVKSISKEKTIWMAREVAMKDLRAGTSTRLVIEKLQLDVPIPWPIRPHHPVDLP